MMQTSLKLKTHLPEPADDRVCRSLLLRSLAVPFLPVTLLLLVMMLTFSSSCASGEKNRPDPPGSSTHQPAVPSADKRIHVSTVYVDEVQLVSGSDGDMLRISGHLPTPCHQLAEPRFESAGDTLNISLESWQEPDMMCAQVLEPFVYYLLPESYGVHIPFVTRVNGEAVAR
jgi:hypothetical protein